MPPEHKVGGSNPSGRATLGSSSKVGIPDDASVVLLAHLLAYSSQHRQRVRHPLQFPQSLMAKSGVILSGSAWLSKEDFYRSAYPHRCKAGGRVGHPPNNAATEVPDTKESVEAAKQQALRLVRLWDKRALYAGGALALSCAAVYPFLQWASAVWLLGILRQVLGAIVYVPAGSVRYLCRYIV